MKYFVGVDTGGTFTDVVLIDEAGRIYFDKAFSTPADPAQGVLAAIENCARLVQRQPDELVSQTERFSHGTTVGTNTLIQRRGSRVGLAMTLGFEDTTLITRGPIGKNLGIPPSQAMDFIHNERPEPLVPKSRIRGIGERITRDGDVVAPLNERDARQKLQDLLAAGAESIAICLLWSFRNDTHEKRLKSLLRDLAPGIPVSLSSEISPLIGEFERAVTTVVNAYVGPVLIRYIGNLQAGLADRGLRNPVQLMTCTGGLTLPESVDRQAASLVNSGPVGGLVAGRYLGETLGLRNIITADMGGTSFDVGVIYGGDFEYEQTPFVSQGTPIQLSAAKVVTIGAGGGSIAWSDGRRLMVGPQSAGASPGPACYGRGGTEPTVTDALVVLGLLDPEYFFGGRTRLERAKAVEAVEARVAGPLGLDVREAAAGIYEIVTAKMSDLIRKVTVESGFDPREFVVFAYGGAGGAHAALYAEALGVREVIVPHAASVFSALGCALSDIKYSYAKSQPLLLKPEPEVIAVFNGAFAGLEQQARQDMESSGFALNEVVLNRRLDLRYEGQMNEITIGWPHGELTPDTMNHVRQDFEAMYEGRFGQGTVRPESPIEIISFRLDALKVTNKPELQAEPEGDPDPAAARLGARDVYLRQTGLMRAEILDGDKLRPGNIVFGPAIIERRDTTIFVPPGQRAAMDGYRNIRIRREEVDGADRPDHV